MRTFKILICSSFFFGINIFAHDLMIKCDRGTGYAEVYTNQGPTQRFYPSNGPFKTTINTKQSFTWGYDAGGEMGPYIALGARILLLNDGQISLQTQKTTRIVTEGRYHFSTSKGHSITCTLRK